MKRVKSILFLPFLAVFFLFCTCLMACNDGVYPTSIVLVTQDVKTEYFVGDNLELNNLEFEVTFSNGEKSNYLVSDLSITDNFADINVNIAGTKTVTFVYQIDSKHPVYVSFPVEFKTNDVVALEIEEHCVQSTVKQYENVNLSNFAAVATYANGEKVNITYDDITVSTFDTRTAGNLEIEFFYNGFCSHIYVEVISLAVVSVDADGIVSTYGVGDEISFDNVILNLHLDNGSEVNVSSRSSSPIILRNVVADKFSIAATGFSTPYAYNFGSVTWKNTIVSICIVTLSLVITGCGSKSLTCSFIDTI